MESSVLYPNCDFGIWFRSVDDTSTTDEPIVGKVTGTIPKWINGCLYQNGPGLLDVTGKRVNHLFDAFALIQKFTVTNGHVMYQNRILQSDAYKKAYETGRSCYSEYGTAKDKDESDALNAKNKSGSSLAWFFTRFQQLFESKNDFRSDNALISIYPYRVKKDKVALFAMTETPVMHEIDPDSVETVSKFHVGEHVPIVSHCGHAVVLNDGTVLNVGLSSGLTGMNYVIFEFPGGSESNMEENLMQKCRVLTKIPCRWSFNPSYMHTFAVTENYFVLIEQSLCISLARVLQLTITHGPLTDAFAWYGNEPVRFRLINRHTMAEHDEYIYLAPVFFFLHTINAYEDNNNVVIDICCYENADMLQCMTIEELEKGQLNPDFAKQFRGRPKRFVLPLSLESNRNEPLGVDYSSCKVTLLDSNNLWIEPELIADVGCELPQIDYYQFHGKFYRYFYAINSDVDYEQCGALRKIDILSKTAISWHEEGCYTSEPIFLRNPDNEQGDEDDGVLLVSLLRTNHDNEVSLLVLNARDLTEIGRVQFEAHGPVPKCLHCLWLDTKPE
ncbi:unnamed protein product [Adineta ricciae]|uniref:Uncharacterized protein n=1 Tax=Adineta ricciae TaxID=249248 RepID=A0A814AKM4_ADIRI|nr:unnamed protein product [Adineta ricciae]CAF1005692.1 unnamed protein product [Adineta ricciae]